MRRTLIPALLPALLLVLALAAAALLYLWWSDWFLIDDCRDMGGAWDADLRICAIDATG